MSIKLMSRVWDSDLNLSSSHKFVLLCLADFANDEGASCYPSYSKIAKKCALSKRSVIRIVQELKQMDILHIHESTRNDGSTSTNKYFINLSMLYKRKYEGWCHDVTVGCHDVTRVVTQCHPIDPSYDPSNIKKNIIKKNEKSDFDKSKKITKEKDKTNELVNDAKEVIKLINRLTGRNYKETTKSYITMIVGRMKEGATLQDCKMVVARKSQEWLGNKVMDQYVRPSTLFRKEKFPDYLAECVTDEELKQRRK